MMLPINDFNFVVAGIATFAATVGYACTRRLSSSFGGSDSDAIRDSIRNQSKVGVEHCQPQTTDESVETSVDVVQVRPELEDSAAIPTKRNGDNLKRKIPHDGFEEPEKPVNSEFGYPHNLAHIYPPPNKRFKTPPGVNDKAPALVEILEQPTAVHSPLNIRDPELAAGTPTPDPPLSPSPVADTPPPVYIHEPSVIKPHSLLKAPTPPAPGIDVPTVPQPTAPQPLQSTLTAPVPAIPKSFGGSSFSGGFAAFAGSSSSPFSSSSDHTPHSMLKSNRPIWSAAPSDLIPHQNDEAGQAPKVTDLFSPAQSLPVNVLEEAKPSTPAPSSKHTHFTGEEDEDVEMELKGVKLYVKRGAKPYGEGIVGHLKLLSHRTTLEERILFRREPLWKVSMNIRVRPTVRCAFVPEENALKFILKENIESPAADSPEANQEFVIYVLKPGRSCSKQDFKDFALTLSENAHFRSSTETPSKSS